MNKKIVSFLLIVVQSCFLHAQNNDNQIIPGNQAGIKPLPVRKVRTELGISQQPNEKLNWMIEARFGMFIHWGLYSGVGKGEWFMENSGTSPEEYRKLAYPQSGNQYFDASQFNAGDWAKLAKDAGMRYMNMVTQHHDGYALFDAEYMDVFCSKQTHNRDFVREYVDACRANGLKVGLYKTLINWRYPGYYDVTGTNCKPNKFGYKTDIDHKENARLMKEELYCLTKELLTRYGKIDQIFWDGGWLAQQGSDADAAYFWEPDKYLDPDNDWKVNPYFQDIDSATGKPLGLMGMVRKYQPDCIVNPRSGWYGDFKTEEGSGAITGQIRTEEIFEKEMTMSSGWGYTPMHDDPSKVISAKGVRRMLVDCTIRNMALLLNVAPDRHGKISKTETDVLLETGKWLQQTGEAIYGTRGGPWQPKDGLYGYAYKNNTIYLFLLEDYKATTFTLPPVNNGQKLVKAYMVDNKKQIKAKQNSREITLSGIDKPADQISVIAIELNKEVIISSTTEAQNSQLSVPGKRVRECFDPDWMFHKDDIAIKYIFRAAKYGGLTDTNVKVVSDETTVIDYTDVKKSTAFKPSDWQKVDLPHDWLVEGTFVNDNSLGSQPAGTGYLPTGIGFYRKEFELPETDKGKKISIEFDGIYRNSSVWVNGNFMGNHPDGYTPSYYDLTDVLRYGTEGKNIILVRVDGRESEGWWYDGCGIYRHTWLVKTDKLHVGRFGTYITTPVVSDIKADVNIKTTLKNEYNTARNITLISKIADNKNVVLDTRSTSQSIAPLSQVEIEQKGLIQKPLLWSPETPDLYKVLTEVTENGNVVDTYETTFGVRTIEINRNGFFLNGKLYPVKGTANHQDFGGLGVALPDKISEYKIKLLKEMGSNGYRSAHNPPTPELLDACDRLGMLVLDENRLLSSTDDNLKELATLLYRDRNHPSIFMWCMENEEPVQGTIMGARILETMVETTHRIDPTRPVTAAMNHGWNTGGYGDVLDIVGYNYGDKRSQYVNDHEKYPQRKMFITECTSFVSTRGEYETNKEKGYVSNIGPYTPDWGPEPGKDWEQIVLNPYMGGLFVWTGFDYRGEPTPYLWPCVSSHFGIMDICGFPKDGYFAYKAAWTKTPLVHLFPHWNWSGKEGRPIKVSAYTNCEEAELFLNGKSVGKKKSVPFTRLEWELVYKPGKLEVRAYNKGKTVAKDIVETTSAPSQIDLNSDCSTIKADGCDVAVIRVAIKDSRGRVVPVADNLVKFTIEGPGRIIGTGNGNPTSHEPDKANQRMAFNGLCMVLIQTDRTAGEIRLKASSDTLKNAELILKAE